MDFSCAMFGPDGGLVANAPHIPVHLGAMQETVQYQVLFCSSTRYCFVAVLSTWCFLKYVARLVSWLSLVLFNYMRSEIWYLFVIKSKFLNFIYLIHCLTISTNIKVILNIDRRVTFLLADSFSLFSSEVDEIEIIIAKKEYDMIILINSLNLARRTEASFLRGQQRAPLDELALTFRWTHLVMRLPKAMLSSAIIRWLEEVTFQILPSSLQSVYHLRLHSKLFDFTFFLFNLCWMHAAIVNLIFFYFILVVSINS